MFGTRWLWVALVGGLLGVAAVALPAAGMISGHTPWFGAPPHPHGPGWSNSTGRYAVTFQESGLPNGTVWSVHISGAWGPTPFGPWTAHLGPEWRHGESNASNGTAVGFLLANGTYHYTVHLANSAGTVYAPSPSSGTLQVNGTNASESVAFAPLSYYTVTFAESGLPSGSFWSVSLAGSGFPAHGDDLGGSPYWGGGGSNGTNGSAVNFSLPDGNYSFQVPNVTVADAVYVASPSSGNVSVNGTNLTVGVGFALLVNYNLTFVESGLPNGTFWSVVLAGSGFGHPGFGPALAASGPDCGSSGFNSSTSTTVGFTVPNGTYGFLISNASHGSVLYLPTPSSGNVSVNGSNVTVSLTFAPEVLYNVTFAETGLPNGTFWSVVVAGNPIGGAWNGSSNATVGFTVPNGSYEFWIPEASNCSAEFAPSPANGTVVVDGSNVTVTVNFSPVLFYNVTFNETGLPNGTVWFVAVFGPGGGWQFEQSNGSSVAFLLPNGTYGFSIGAFWANGSAYLPQPSFGNLTVSGANLTLAVSFSAGPTVSVALPADTAVAGGKGY